MPVINRYCQKITFHPQHSYNYTSVQHLVSGSYERNVGTLFFRPFLGGLFHPSKKMWVRGILIPLNFLNDFYMCFCLINHLWNWLFEIQIISCHWWIELQENYISIRNGRRSVYFTLGIWIIIWFFQKQIICTVLSNQFW